MQNACNQNKYMVGAFVDFDALTIHQLFNGTYFLLEEFPSKDIPIMKEKYKDEPLIIKGINKIQVSINFEKEFNEKQKALAARTVKTPNIQSPTA